MSNQNTEIPRDANVVLVVPKRHVKTVKTALEKSGFLDQSLKITPETREKEIEDSDSGIREQEKDANAEGRDGFVPVPRPDQSATATSELLSQDSEPAGPFPRLEFDPSSGQYVEPAVLSEKKEQSEFAAGEQFPRLEFDSSTGQYVEPFVLEKRKEEEPETANSKVSQEDSTATDRFPTLEFDPITGQYIEPSNLKTRNQGGSKAVNPKVFQDDSGVTDQFPALQFNPISGQYVEPSVIEERQRQELGATGQFPSLQFDSVTGQYVNPSMMERKKQESRAEDERMRIPTTIPYFSVVSTGLEELPSLDPVLKDLAKSRLLDDFALSHLFEEITLSYRALSASEDYATRLKNPFHQALKEALDALPEPTLSSLKLTAQTLVSSVPDAYSVYNPLLLLPNNALSSPSWTKLLATHPTDSELLQPLWRRIAAAVGATHIAINSPIPLNKPNEHSSSANAQPNILRSPANLRPIYGDFGSPPTPQTLSSPTPSDFTSAFWVTTTQNGIQQTWAPLYTMFSRGNIREKTRILNLPSVTACPDAPYTAVDLYAGIGYFAFSYKKGGQQSAGKMLCWELNPWSVEGLRRGAELNGWTCRVFTNSQIPGIDAEWDSFRTDLETLGNADFWVFQTSNEHAEPTIRALARHSTSLVPPIRHINLGLLPSSTLSWPTAVRLVDTEKGGWIHVHENVGAREIVARTSEVASAFQDLVSDVEGEAVEKRRRVVVEYAEKVKTYAPGVVHIVFDVRVEGRETVGV